eukprot:Nk52_evm1s1577 gene=Nk52_evmTU1s1577
MSLSENSIHRKKFVNSDDYFADVQKKTDEYMIAVEGIKVVQDRLMWCYRKEGVNHQRNCKHLVDQYWQMMKDLPDTRVQQYNLLEEEGIKPANRSGNKPEVFDRFRENEFKEAKADHPR